MNENHASFVSLRARSRTLHYHFRPASASSPSERISRGYGNVLQNRSADEGGSHVRDKVAVNRSGGGERARNIYRRSPPRFSSRRARQSSRSVRCARAGVAGSSLRTRRCRWRRRDIAASTVDFPTRGRKTIWRDSGRVSNVVRARVKEFRLLEPFSRVFAIFFHIACIRLAKNCSL